MTRRIVIHAGFHKTGTTTLQRTLALNAATFMPHAEVYLQNGLTLAALQDAVLTFSGNRCKETKRIITGCAHDLFSSFDLNDPRPILISSESLSGHFPGSAGVGKYGSAPVAIELIRDAWRDVTGSADGFEVYYSTRRNGWLASCHWQRLSSGRARVDLDFYSQKYAQAADHTAILDEIRLRLGAAAVHSCALEDMDHPVEPVLKILGLTALRPDLRLPRNANVSPPMGVREKLLELNRSELRGQDYERAKLALFRGRD
nr:hypothetical protein [uncultured Celeribacter sp.]